MIRLPSLPLNASILHFNTRNLTISRLFAVTLNSLIHDFIAQAGRIFLYLNCTDNYDIVHRQRKIFFSIFRHSSFLDRYLTVHVKRHVRVYAPADCARYQLKHFFGELMERRSRMLVAFSGYFSVTVIGTDRSLKDLKLIFFNGSK